MTMAKAISALIQVMLLKMLFGDLAFMAVGIREGSKEQRPVHKHRPLDFCLDCVQMDYFDSERLSA